MIETRGLREIAEHLLDVGFTVHHVRETVGSITGAAGKDVMVKVHAIKVVAGVSPDLPVRGGPPGSPDPW